MLLLAFADAKRRLYNACLLRLSQAIAGILRGGWALRDAAIRSLPYWQHFTIIEVLLEVSIGSAAISLDCIDATDFVVDLQSQVFHGKTMTNRKEIADMIVARMTAEKERMAAQYAASRVGIGYFYIDDLLPEALARAIHAQFPKPETMKLKKTLREYKYIAAQMNNYDAILEETVYAFQDERVVEIVKNICDMKSAYPDSHLYAGGISMMGKDQYLNPHLDNSHDKDRDRWRVLNLLYYVTPDWKEENGGNLEVWPGGVEQEQTVIHSRFNRLAVMATHNQSWHSVSPIKVNGFRCCISNYYFADEALKHDDTFHVTSFRGRPEQKLRDVVLRADATARMAVRKVFAKGVVENEHLYKRDQNS
ncbi:2OG-Fe(II) oxygenase [Sphingomonas sp. Leaf10]|uniref:2OG-Fe(II) oxygenase n=1 Tax=Sphingomonas sp. Leaf10 TaxID=1735676 RepID=UPI000A89BE61|nr:2OG-Fe(II) oxygenase [Sphingomonas sp. Leaf10]